MKKRDKDDKSADRRVAAIEDLKERLENVEVINHYETTLAERALEAESEVGTSDLPGRESSMEEK